MQFSHLDRSETRILPGGGISGEGSIARKASLMPDAFDPYFKWLGIPKADQPPHGYRLLGIELL